MKLPSGYYIAESNDGKKWLYENVPVTQPKRSDQDEPPKEPCAVGPELDMMVRPVASFRMGCTNRDIEDVAERDHISRSPRYRSKTEREEAFLWLARRFERERIG